MKKARYYLFAIRLKQRSLMISGQWEVIIIYIYEYLSGFTFLLVDKGESERMSFIALHAS